MDWRTEFLTTWERLTSAGFMLARDETTQPALDEAAAEGHGLTLIDRLQALEARLELLARRPAPSWSTWG